MASLFPGMDPFIEAQRWEGFHTHYIVELSRVLVPQIRPQYVVETEERIYLERFGEPPRVIRADASVERVEGWSAGDGSLTEAQEAVSTIAPVVCVLPVDEEVREVFLTIRDRATRDVVTIIEMLSPGNKRSGSDGRSQYLQKRREVLQSSVHLVELDLLRGGRRMPVVDRLPPGDYYAFVCRTERRPEADVYAWELRRRLPAIPVPLKGEDPDVLIDLQAVLDSTFDGLGYDYALDYSRQLDPPLGDSDDTWVDQLLQSAGKKGGAT